MAYITNADIEERLGSQAYVQLTDDDLGVVDEARLGAEGEVNGYLARRYQVPIDLTAHPELAEVLASVTLDVVEYRLRLRRPPVSEDGRRRFAQTVEWLERVAKGEADLPSAGAIAGSTTRGPLAATTGERRVLTREEMSDH